MRMMIRCDIELGATQFGGLPLVLRTDMRNEVVAPKGHSADCATATVSGRMGAGIRSSSTPYVLSQCRIPSFLLHNKQDECASAP